MSTLTSTSTTYFIADLCGSIVCCVSPTLRLETDPHTPWRRITRHQGVSNLRIFQRRSPSVSCWPLWVDPGGGFKKREEGEVTHLNVFIYNYMYQNIILIYKHMNIHEYQYKYGRVYIYNEYICIYTYTYIICTC